LHPFFEGTLELFNGKFDLPDRIFHNIHDSFFNATDDLSDVRELVPEFYFMPEFLINQEGLDFGQREDKENVNHVKLPPYANNDPYYFV
jgi:hypothetical protein